MRFLARGSAQYICLPRVLNSGRKVVHNASEYTCVSRSVVGLSLFSTKSQVLAVDRNVPISKRHPRNSDKAQFRLVKDRKIVESAAASKDGLSQNGVIPAEAGETPIELSPEQMERVTAVHKLAARLQIGTHNLARADKTRNTVSGIPIETVLAACPVEEDSPGEAHVRKTLQEAYAGQPYGQVRADLSKAGQHRNPAQRKVKNPETKIALVKLGLLSTTGHQSTNTVRESTFPVHANSSSADDTGFISETSESRSSGAPSASPRKQSISLVKTVMSTGRENAERESTKTNENKGASQSRRPPARTPDLKTIDSADLILEPVGIGKEARIPQLSFDLSRVLFNPGVYHLRDPRSRVYNFDPYLEQPMPLTEFNFDGLNDYVTSSEDQTLIGIATDLKKRYVGSSSSLSSILCHFHYLLSQWRELNTSSLSRGFEEQRKDYTVISRSPAAVFLRYRDGVYAVDADKEYDEPNVLTSLGKSLEKLLTLEKSEIEKWRRTHTAADRDFSDPQDEAFHYSTQGSFLLRSQLDAQDSRLPGSGVFDLKTRAVAGIRMNMGAHEEGMGYQIKDRLGTWESFEREYYDMMRSTFLKYSMQVRMGNMDGIFVAFHNIERMFGFQYISLAEMDHAIHGQHDPSLGDREFSFSVNFLTEIFDVATQEFPEQSLRFYFEAREPSVTEPKAHLQIFAEPMTNDEIDEMQRKKHDAFVAYEKKLFYGEEAAESEISEHATTESADAETQPESELLEETESIDEATSVPSELMHHTSSRNIDHSTAADSAFLDAIIDSVPADTTPKAPRPVMAFRLTIQNQVNDFPVIRPSKMTAGDKWKIDYQLDRLGDDVARRQSTFCKNRRMSALSFKKRSTGYFIEKIRRMSFRGAEWRKQQDEIDAQQEQVILYDGQNKT